MRILMFGALALITACGGSETPTPTEPAAAPAPAPTADPAPAPAADPAPAAAPAPATGTASGSTDLGAMSAEEQMAFLMKEGETVYKTGGKAGVACMTCHMENGEGVPGAFPPLKGQKDHMGDCATHAAMIINGLTGAIEVNGINYNGVMPPQATLTDLEIAAVTTYERNSWGNDYGLCLPDAAAGARP